MKDSGIYYSLGALLYTAADNTNIVDDIIFEKFNIPFSLAFSFDTTSNDAEADKAENVLIKTLDKLFVAKKERNFYIPKLQHISHIFTRSSEAYLILSPDLYCLTFPYRMRMFISMRCSVSTRYFPPLYIFYRSLTAWRFLT